MCPTSELLSASELDGYAPAVTSAVSRSHTSGSSSSSSSSSSSTVVVDYEDNEGHLEMAVSRREEEEQERRLIVRFAHLATAADAAAAERRITPAMMKFYRDFAKRGRTR